jgi:hypothetical protein
MVYSSVFVIESVLIVMGVDWRFQCVNMTILSMVTCLVLMFSKWECFITFIAFSIIFIAFSIFSLLQIWRGELHMKNIFVENNLNLQKIMEKNEILEYLPDGAIIFRDSKSHLNIENSSANLQADSCVQIRYVNKTFQNMFRLHDHIKKKLKGNNLGEDMPCEAELQRKIQEFMKIDFNQEFQVNLDNNQKLIVDYLKSIQVCRTDYTIRDNKVVQISDKEHQIHNLFELISKMHDGQIFEYIVRPKAPGPVIEPE